MEDIFVRHFSTLPPYQTAHRMVYRAVQCPCGVQLTVQRTDADPAESAATVALPWAQGLFLLRYLYENAVPPESWQDVIDDLAGLPAEADPLPCPQ